MPPREARIEQVAVEDLKPHPRNYRSHPPDQLEHLVRSIEEHGFYRNVVVARDNTVLAGHGVTEAARKMGLKKVPVIRLDVEPNSPEAMKVLTGDNELGNLAEVDDRALSVILKGILDESESLLGTGFDEARLAALVYTTRPESEVGTIDAAKEWVGLPDYVPADKPVQLNVLFETEEARSEFMRQVGLATVHKVSGHVHSTWWPERPKQDLASLRFSDKEKPE